MGMGLWWQLGWSRRFEGIVAMLRRRINLGLRAAARWWMCAERIKVLLAGLEITKSECIDNIGVQKSCYIGLSLRWSGQLASAAAINLFRVIDWRSGECWSETPVAAFVALASTWFRQQDQDSMMKGKRKINTYLRIIDTIERIP